MKYHMIIKVVISTLKPSHLLLLSNFFRSFCRKIFEIHISQ
jgi:hypothetical protein